MESALIKPNYSYVFPFEDNFSINHGQQWMEKNWHMSFYYAAAYVLFIFIGRTYMQNKPAADLTLPLAFWNLLLGAFSIIGFCRTLPEMSHVLTTRGLYYSVCDSSYITQDKVSSFWALLFVLSKAIELGDTAFIVLRKKPLMLLHWYHHASVLTFSWYIHFQNVGPARWYVFMNYFIHSFMYTYYTIMAFRIRLPKWTSFIITTSQILQMVIGFAVTFWGFWLKRNGRPCDLPDRVAVVGLFMYSSYFVLFAKMFLDRYVGTKGDRRKNVTKKKQI